MGSSGDSSFRVHKEENYSRWSGVTLEKKGGALFLS